MAGKGVNSGALAGTEPAQQGIPQDICRVAQPSSKANARAEENSKVMGKMDFMMASVVGSQRRNFPRHGYNIHLEHLY
jgi:hypothetical protein